MWRSILLSVVVASSALGAREVARLDQLPGSAVGVLQVGNLLCSAFLSGVQQITTAAHCIRYGIEGGFFYLGFKRDAVQFGADDGRTAAGDLKNGTYRPIAALTNILVTGGGFTTVGQLKGTDWAHIKISRPLGATYGYLEISNQELARHANVTITSYHSRFRSGNVMSQEQCRVEDPPVQTRQYCTRIPNTNDYECNFFQHSCSSADGDSGAPITVVEGGVPKAVGIHSGIATIGNRVRFSTAVTTNESSTPAANVVFHWLNLRNYVSIQRINETLPNGFTVNTTQSLVTEYRALLQRCRTLSATACIAQIQRWDSLAGQQHMLALARAFWENRAANNPTIALADPVGVRADGPANVFASYYGSNGARATELAYLTPPSGFNRNAMSLFHQTVTRATTETELNSLIAEGERELRVIDYWKANSINTEYATARWLPAGRDTNRARFALIGLLQAQLDANIAELRRDLNRPRPQPVYATGVVYYTPVVVYFR